MTSLTRPPEGSVVAPGEPANDAAGPFSIGQAAVWPGLAKLAEECGEVIQVIGKLIATGGETRHWSGRDLLRDLEDELADVQAAAAFVIARNALLDQDRIHDRAGSKVGLFSEWHGDNSDYRKRLWTAYLYGRRSDGLPRY